VREGWSAEDALNLLGFCNARRRRALGSSASAGAGFGAAVGGFCPCREGEETRLVENGGPAGKRKDLP
jgi:hypothetical protein